MCLEANDLALGGAVTSAHAQNVLYCVGSDFMEVKQLATTFIRQLPASTVGLQVHNLNLGGCFIMRWHGFDTSSTEPC